MASALTSSDDEQAQDDLARAIRKRRTACPPYELAWQLLVYDQPGHTALVGTDIDGTRAILYHELDRYVIVVSFGPDGLNEGGAKIAEFRGASLFPTPDNRWSMCGRMSLTKAAPDLEGRFGVTFDYQFEPRYNIAPGDDLDVVPNDDPKHAARLEWGIVPHWVDDPADWPSPINARAETVAEKPAFRGAF